MFLLYACLRMSKSLNGVGVITPAKRLGFGKYSASNNEIVCSQCKQFSVIIFFDPAINLDVHVGAHFAEFSDFCHGLREHGLPTEAGFDKHDENGVELYWDRPNEAWPRTTDGKLAMFTRRLDLEDLLRQRET